MGLEIYIHWFKDGAPATVPYESVRRAFGTAVGPIDAFGYRVTYGRSDEAFVFVRGEVAVSHLLISRPCRDVALWDAIVATLRLGHGLCIWPGTASAVASDLTLAHLPPEFEGQRAPTLVRDGAELARIVGSS
jgi:hypothetical protein